MSDLTSLHGQARRLTLLLREGMERLEALEGASSRPAGTGDAPHAGGPTLATLSRDLRAKLHDLTRISGEMDAIWRMQVIRENTSKRDVWKRKVEQVADELDTIRAALERHAQREGRRAAEACEREELLSRGELGRKAKQDMDEEAAAAGSVARSKRYLEEMYDAGSAILVSMAGNRERLKSAHKKALDVLNTVGLGESLLRLIERRQRADRVTAYVGMVVVLLIVALAVWWFWF